MSGNSTGLDNEAFQSLMDLILFKPNNSLYLYSLGNDEGGIEQANVETHLGDRDELYEIFSESDADRFSQYQIQAVQSCLKCSSEQAVLAINSALEDRALYRGEIWSRAKFGGGSAALTKAQTDRVLSALAKSPELSNLYQADYGYIHLGSWTNKDLLLNVGQIDLLKKSLVDIDVNINLTLVSLLTYQDLLEKNACAYEIVPE